MTEDMPCPSATVLLLRERDGIEVLMVERGAGAVFGSALVFPGGKLDDHDQSGDWAGLVEGGEALDPLDRALRIAAWREVYEEVGLLPGSIVPVADRAARFIDRVREAELRLPLGDMHLMARWITPRRMAQRFDTFFYIAALDEGEAICDGFEAVSAEWITPEHAITLGERGERNLMFPTRAQLRRISGFSSLSDLFEAQRGIGLVPIEPRREMRGDRLFAVIPPDAGYDICEEDITDLM